MADKSIEEAAGSEVFSLIAELCNTLGCSPIAGKVWEYHIDKQWSVAVNGCEESRSTSKEFEAAGMMGCQSIPSFTAAIFFNGWLAGLVDPYDGTIAAGEVANEDALIAALEKKLTEVRNG